MTGAISTRTRPFTPTTKPGYPMPHLFTVEEYLAFENESERKHEFIDGIIYDMTGGTSNHSEIAVNIIVGIATRIRENQLFAAHRRYAHQNS